MSPPTILTAGFRVYFLAPGLYAVAALAVCLIWLGDGAEGGATVSIPFAGAPHIWHAHEMIHGFAAAAIEGFLLTSVPN